MHFPKYPVIPIVLFHAFEIDFGGLILSKNGRSERFPGVGMSLFCGNIEDHE
jgi:hypothetical protein